TIYSSKDEEVKSVARWNPEDHSLRKQSKCKAVDYGAILYDDKGECLESLFLKCLEVF
ncbi:hypothetical protein J1605_011659, partial [Eschrichtius robustus]